MYRRRVAGQLHWIHPGKGGDCLLCSVLFVCPFVSFVLLCFFTSAECSSSCPFVSCVLRTVCISPISFLPIYLFRFLLLVPLSVCLLGIPYCLTLPSLIISHLVVFPLFLVHAQVASTYWPLAEQLADLLGTIDVLGAFAAVALTAPIPYVRPHIEPEGMRALSFLIFLLFSASSSFSSSVSGRLCPALLLSLPLLVSRFFAFLGGLAVLLQPLFYTHIRKLKYTYTTA